MAQNGFSFELVGVKELMSSLEQLPTISMKKTVVRNALKKAGQPIAAAAKNNVPVDSGHLKESLVVSTKLKPSQKHGGFDRSTVTVYVGSTSPLAHLVEFGTTERVLKHPHVVRLKNGNTALITETGKMTPNPFFRNAWDAMKETALRIFIEQMREEIYKAARRLARRAEKGTLTKSQIRGLSK